MNQVYVDGGPAVSGDDLNNFVQTLNVMSDLRAFIGAGDMQVSVLGQNAINDLGGGTFYWNATGTAPDDNGVTTVVPNGSAAGEWTRLLPISTAPIPDRFILHPSAPTPTNSLSGVMMGLGVQFTPAKSGAFILSITGYVTNTVSGDGATPTLRYGTGTPPPSAGAVVGTVISSTFFDAAAAGQSVPFALQGYVGSLTLGTTYWLDLALASFTGGSAAVAGLTAMVVEL